MDRHWRKPLVIFLILYCVASLVHFAHNAEFLSDYPNLPETWSRAGVYLVWLGITAIGISGWLLIVCGYLRSGLLVVAVYAVFGLDSLGHYVVASFSEHTLAMNSTILFEVIAAFLVLVEAMRQLIMQFSRKTKPIQT